MGLTLRTRPQGAGCCSQGLAVGEEEPEEVGKLVAGRRGPSSGLLWPRGV
jgi:hypothetical protein